MKYEGYTIRKLLVEDLTEFQQIALKAYPVMFPENYSPEAQQAWFDRMKSSIEEDPLMNYYGCFKSDKMIGGMIYFDFKMTLFDQLVDVGGIGLVCVDLLHKKEHAAKNIVKAFHDHYYGRGITLTALYPFRPDFYTAMGYGLGKKMNRYRFKPSTLPKGSKEHIVKLSLSDSKKTVECFNRFASGIHGMIQTNKKAKDRLFTRQNVIGYMQDNELQGFMAFTFKKVDPDNFILQDLIVEELIYENSHALRELLAYLNTQADQVRYMYFHTQDDFFHYLLHDPRNGGKKIFLTSQECNLQGLGIMYRIINVRKLFTDLSTFNFRNQTVKLLITLEDNFLKPNDGKLILYFDNGICSVMDDNHDFDAEIQLKINHFSSMFMGVVPFKKLYSLGLAHISNLDYLDTINQLFTSEHPPITTQQF
ncbi:GNAT family N-acetyltransferase [Candidatus Heimdallarchaeota archaeon B3_Heim]|nr:MAG: GNAT family N-acetyltransferase [Candidatus Heimdallarchaeota archaeon B3_Heim]